MYKNNKERFLENSLFAPFSFNIFVDKKARIKCIGVLYFLQAFVDTHCRAHFVLLCSFALSTHATSLMECQLVQLAPFIECTL